MEDPRYEPVLIGPIGAGKSTLGRLLAERLGLPQVAVDFLRFRYYEEIGYDGDVAGRIREQGGFPALLAHWKPFEAHGVERILAEHARCVFDFGAGHSLQEDLALFARLRAALAPFANVILLLPSPDDAESLRLLAERRPPAVADGFNFDELCVRGPCNRALATTVVYTDGRTPEQTRDEIIAGLHGRDALVPAETAEHANALAASGELGLGGAAADQDRAARALEGALAIRRRLGAPGPVADALVGLSRLEGARQHAEAARALAESALSQCPPWDAPRRERALFAVAEAAQAAGDGAGAAAALEACLEIRRALGRGRPVAQALLTLAQTRGRRGETARAEAALAEARRWFTALGSGGALREVDRVARRLAAPTEGPFAALRNGIGIGEDGQSGPADADGGGWAYSAQALAAAGAVPGGVLVAGGLGFAWPQVPAGQADHVEVAGQTVLVPSRPGARQLALLGAATNGGSAGTGTLRHADGGTSTCELRFPDWTLGGGRDAPEPGVEVAVRSAYRRGPAGQPDRVETLLFVQRLPLDPDRPVLSVTLPAAPGPGTLHLFGLALAD